MKDLVKRCFHHSPLLRGIYIRTRFRVERQLLHGTHETANEHPSILHFSLNRSATQYTKRLLCRCAIENGMTPAHFNEYAFQSDMPFLDHLSENQMAKYRHIFKERGYLYSVFGGFVRGIPNLDQYHILVMVRDPRDILTSLYFSAAYSHPLPGDPRKAARFLETRAWAREISVDEYVLAKKDKYADRCRTYIAALRDMPNAHFLKYEDMIGDFLPWLDGLLSRCELSVSHQTKAKIIEEARSSKPERENILKHKRQVIPGDYKRKLSENTVATLNKDLSDVLNAFGYS